MLTMSTWPPFKDGTWELSREPAWWQFQIFALGGIALTAIPSFIVYQLDAFFHSHESFRYPFVAAIVAIEIAFICLFAFFASCSSTRAAQLNRHAAFSVSAA